MPKTEVYSWRVSRPLKSALEEAARAERMSVADLLDRVTGEWLAGRMARAGSGAAEQARLHAGAMRLAGSLRGGDPARAAQARERLKAKLTRRRAG
jgi:hypothetical protein